MMKDGEYLEAGGMPVGHCNLCGFNQRRLYFLDEKGYCPACFPMAVNIKIAKQKLEEFKS